MEGQLADASMAEVCRGLATASATGTLHVQGPGGEAALKFLDGALVSVKGPTSPARIGDRLVHAGLLSRTDLDRTVRAQQSVAHPTEYLGELLVDDGLVDGDAVRVFLQEQILDALADVLDWPEGRYHFTRHEVRGRPIAANLPVDRALSEATRRILESRNVERHLPDRGAIVQVVPDVEPVELEPEEVAVLDALEGGNSVGGVADVLGFGVRDTARIVWGLRLLGLVDVTKRRMSSVNMPGSVESSTDDDIVVEEAAGPDDDELAADDEPADDDAEPTEEDLLDTVRVDSDADEPDRPRRRLFGRQ